MLTASEPHSLHAADVAREFDALCAHLAKNRSRIEIIVTHGSCDCVLISKEELDSLENALQILADSVVGQSEFDA